MPEAAHSPLVDLEAELRVVDRKRQEALRSEAPQRIAPGSWSQLETTVYFEQAA